MMPVKGFHQNVHIAEYSSFGTIKNFGHYFITILKELDNTSICYSRVWMTETVSAYEVN